MRWCVGFGCGVVDVEWEGPHEVRWGWCGIASFPTACTNMDLHADDQVRRCLRTQCDAFGERTLEYSEQSVECGGVRWSVVVCGGVWWSVVGCGGVWCGVVWWGVVWCGAVWCGVV